MKLSSISGYELERQEFANAIAANTKKRLTEKNMKKELGKNARLFTDEGIVELVKMFQDPYTASFIAKMLLIHDVGDIFVFDFYSEGVTKQKYSSIEFVAEVLGWQTFSKLTGLPFKITRINRKEEE